MTPRLVAVSGPLSGWTIYLDDPLISIGRNASNSINLDDPYVSRQHCVIRGENEHSLIEDLNSANGTYVNFRRIKECSLVNGILIDIGRSRFIFWLEEFDEVALSPAPVLSTTR